MGVTMDDKVDMFVRGQLLKVEAALSDCRDRYAAADRMGMKSLKKTLGREIQSLKLMAYMLSVKPLSGLGGF